MADVVVFSKDGERRINMFEADLIFPPKKTPFIDPLQINGMLKELSVKLFIA